MRKRATVMNEGCPPSNNHAGWETFFTLVTQGVFLLQRKCFSAVRSLGIQKQHCED